MQCTGNRTAVVVAVAIATVWLRPIFGEVGARLLFRVRQQCFLCARTCTCTQARCRGTDCTRAKAVFLFLHKGVFVQGEMNSMLN